MTTHSLLTALRRGISYALMVQLCVSPAAPQVSDIKVPPRGADEAQDTPHVQRPSHPSETGDSAADTTTPASSQDDAAPQAKDVDKRAHEGEHRVTEEDPETDKQATASAAQSIQHQQLVKAEQTKLSSRGKGTIDLQSGAFTYSYTFETSLPQPLVLTYNSASARGPGEIASAGWSLNLSYVARNPEYSYADTELADDTFELTLNGAQEKLVYINSTGCNHHYYARRNPTLRIVAQGENRHDPSGWTVETGDGVTYHFDQQLPNSARGYCMKWYLTCSEDAQVAPNKTRYYYSATVPGNVIGDDTSQSQGVLYLDRITTRDLHDESAEGDLTVVLKYSLLPSWTVQYQQGLRVSRTYRLCEVHESFVTPGGSAQRPSHYRLSYDDSRHVCGGLLTSISDKTDTEERPPVVFSYHSPLPTSDECQHTAVWQGHGPGQQISCFRHDLHQGEFDFCFGSGRLGEYDRYLQRMNATLDRSDPYDRGIGGVAMSSICLQSTPDVSIFAGPATFYLTRDSDSFDPEVPPDCLAPCWERSVSGRMYQRRTDVLDIDNDGFPDMITKDINALWSYDTLIDIVRARVGADGEQGDRGNPSDPRLTDDNEDAWLNRTRRQLSLSGQSANPDDFFQKTIADTPSFIYSSFCDVNGDGLQDFIIAGPEPKFYRNTGLGFAVADWLPPPSGHFLYLLSCDMSEGHRSGGMLCDVNGDGLSDFVEDSGNSIYFGTGSGFEQSSVFPAPPTDWVWQRSDGDETTGWAFSGQLAYDFNGDGFCDMVSVTSASVHDTQRGFNASVYFNKGDHFDTTPVVIPHLALDSHAVPITFQRLSPATIVAVTDELGGVIDIDYYDSAEFYANAELGPDQKYHVPKSPLWPVRQVRRKPQFTPDTTAQGFVQTNTYEYSGPWYEYNEGAVPDGSGGWNYSRNDQELRGFAKVVEYDGSGKHTVHEFFQDDYRRGIEHTATVRSDTDGSIYTRVERLAQAMTRTEQGLWEWVSFTPTLWDANLDALISTYVVSETNYLFDGEVTPVISVVNHRYDDYGNEIVNHSEGDPDDPDDDVVVWSDYYYNTGDWIIGKIKRERVSHSFQIDGSPSAIVPSYTPPESEEAYLRSTSYYYDQAYGSAPTETAPVHGNLTHVVRKCGYQYYTVTAAFDDYGNQTDFWDAKGHRSHTDYDQTSHAFPVRSYDALGFAASPQYCTEVLDLDYQDGKPKEVLDPNGITQLYAYDDFGRLTRQRTLDATDTAVGRKYYQYFEYDEANHTPAGTLARVCTADNDMTGWTHISSSTDWAELFRRALPPRTASRSSRTRRTTLLVTKYESLLQRLHPYPRCMSSLPSLNRASNRSTIASAARPIRSILTAQSHVPSITS